MSTMMNADAVQGVLADRPMPWLNCFEIDDSRIDCEHRALLDSCNMLCALDSGDAESGYATALATELMASIKAHFASEEALFPAINFAHQQDHRREHETVLDTLASLFRGDCCIDFHAAVATTRMMLIEHIIRYDLSYKTFVEEARGF